MSKANQMHQRQKPALVSKALDPPALKGSGNIMASVLGTRELYILRTSLQNLLQSTRCPGPNVLGTPRPLELQRSEERFLEPSLRSLC